MYYEEDFVEERCMMGKKALKILLVGFLLIIITGCSESTPTGEMVYKNPATGILSHGHALCMVSLF